MPSGLDVAGIDHGDNQREPAGVFCGDGRQRWRGGQAGDRRQLLVGYGFGLMATWGTPD